jgi:hypothetical protein
MPTELPRLRSGIELDTTTFTAGVERVIGSVRNLGTSTDQQTRTMARGFDVVTTSMRNFAAGFGVAFGSVAAGQLGQFSRQALNIAGNLGEMATQAGVTTTELQKMEFAALQVGVSQSELVNLLSQFGRRVGEADAKANDFRKTLDRYNISIRDGQNNIRSSVDILGDLAEAVQNAGSAQEQLAIVSAAFGSRLGRQLLPLLVEGREGFLKLGDAAVQAGLVLGADFIDQADRASDSLESLQYALSKGFQIGIVEEFAQSINVGTEGLIAARAAGEALGRTVGTVLKYITGAIDLFHGLAKAVDGLLDSFGALGDYLRLDLLDIIDSVIDGIKKLVGIPDTSLEAIAPPEVIERLNKMRESFGAVGDSASDAASASESAMAKMIEQAQVENRQLIELVESYKTYGFSVETITRGIEIENQLRAAKISLVDAEKSGLLDLLTSNQLLKKSVEELAAAEEKRMKQFAEMATREGDLRLLQQKSLSRQDLGVPTPGPKADQEKLAEEIKGLWQGVGQSIQSSFADTYEEIFRGGITSFGDLATQIKDIFIRLAAEIAALMTAKALFGGLTGGLAGLKTEFAGFAQAFGTLGGGPGGFMGAPSGATGAGLLGAGAIGALGGSLLAPMLFGGGAGSQIGGGVGGGLGAAAGTFLGGPLGGLAGGLLGSLGGGFFGSLFGGGSQSNQVSIRGGLGISGQGQAAKFVAGIDASLQQMLDATQEATADRILEVADAVRVEYSKQLSANDMARLAKGRIGPVAGALGFNVAEITKGTGEQQLASLQQALAIQKQIEGFQLGPIKVQFRDLEEQFDALEAEANRLGVSTAGLSEEYSRQRKLLGLEFRRQDAQFKASAGVISQYTASQRMLRIEHEQAKLLADQYGVSIKDLNDAYKEQVQALRLQHRAEDVAFSQSIGAISEFQAQFKLLEIEFRQSKLVADEYGISLKQLVVGYREAKKALELQQQSQIVDFQATLGVITPYTASQRELRIQYEQAKLVADDYGVSVKELNKAFKEAREVLRLQRSEEKVQFKASLGVISEYKAAQLSLTIQFEQAKLVADEFGVSMKELNAAFKDAQALLKLRYEAEKISFMQGLGIIDDYEAEQRLLNNRFAEARLLAKEYGISLKQVAEAQKIATAQLKLQHQNERVEFLRSLGIITDYTAQQRLLRIQFAQAKLVAAQYGISIAEVERAQKRASEELAAAERQRRRDMRLQIDDLARSITDPFEQLIEPLRAFGIELDRSLLNPLQQFEAAAQHFRDLAKRAMAGNIEAIEQLDEAGRDFIATATAVGASPGAAAATAEVQSTIDAVMANLTDAQKEAMEGLEGVIRDANRRQIDKLEELIDAARDTKAAIDKLNRELT